MLCYSLDVIYVEAQIVENRRSGNNSVLTVRAPGIANTSRPGQFVMAAPAAQGGVPVPLLKRALAVFSIVAERGSPSLITLLVKAVGDGTRRLIESREGQSLDLIGPLGNGFDLGRGTSKINLLVAGGTGIASVFLLAQELARQGEEVHLVYGGRSAADLIGLDCFARLGIPLVTTTEDGSHGDRGLVTDALRCLLERFPAEHVNLYTCGPAPMMEAVSRTATERGIPCQLSVEVKMGCGFGVCLGCTVMTRTSYRLACTHGPVFDAGEFVWESMARSGT